MKMFDKKTADKIDKFLHQNLSIIFDFEFNGLLLLGGGAVKGFIMNTAIKDYDFFLLTQEKDNIMDFINKYNLKYQINPGHGYTIYYNNLLIGINSTNDLCYIGKYNTDFLFYDIHRKQFIPIGIKQAIEKRKVIIYGYDGYPRIEKRKSLAKKLNTAKQFIQYMNNDTKKVKVVRKNKYYQRLFIGFIKKPQKITKLFRG